MLRIEQLRVRLKQMSLAAEHAEVAEAGVQTPFWKDFLEPLLEAKVESFPYLCWTLDPAEFATTRAAAVELRQLLETVRNLPGRKGDILAEAERISDALDKAQKAGLIMSSEE